MMYLTFDEYKKFGGTLDESTFNSLSFDVQAKIDYYTFDRLTKDTKFSEKVKRCVFKIYTLINTFNEYQKVVTDLNNPILTSQSNDGVSVSYGGYLGSTTPRDMEVVQKQLDIDIRNTIKQYLANEVNQDGKSLLYRGVY